MFPLPSLKSSTPSSKTSEDHPRKKFDVSKPRRMYWSDEVPHAKRCPECTQQLETESHPYLLATKHSGKTDFFIVGGQVGYFCSRCPVVVLDRKTFVDLAVAGLRTVDSFEYSVLGIVDLDAIPEDKKHLSVGDENNPLPLVEFSNFTPVNIGRNDPCPCGSGKKYKKCCGIT